MATISRTGISEGGTIQPAHITNIIDALDGTSATTTVVATGSFTGSLIGTLTGTASFATTALSASYAANVPVTASYALAALSSSYAVTASFALNAGASGGGGIFALTGSKYATTNNLEITGSLQVTAGVTASLQGTASFAVSASRAVTASFADTADQLLVQRVVTEATFYPVISDSANATATPERLKSTTNITINPGTNVIAGANFSGSFNVTGSMGATKFSTVDLRILGEASAIGQMAIPIQQTGGTPFAGSIYWDDVAGRLYIYSATNAGWYNIPLNP
jgi:hypothetical protein